MPILTRRQQIALHLRAELGHLKAIARHARGFLWDLRGLVRAVLGR